MHRVSKIVIAALLIAIALLIWSKRARTPARVESQELPQSTPLLAALGRIEGREETISLGAAADGVVKEVLVAEGERVRKGTLLATIDCEDVREAIDMAKAQADSARQSRVRLLRGHRDEERKAALQDTDAAKAVLAQAQEHFGRFDALYQKGEISRDAFEQSKRDFEVAQANYERAVDEQNLVSAEALPEEISRADAEVAAAERNVTVTADKLEKCEVRAPISGTILKVMTKSGESYSTLLPHPLFTLADDSVRRVRAEVDERDIGKVKLGQVSVITADAFPGQRFDGQVVQISPAMEAKSVLSEDPSQKMDRDVLDVIIELKRIKEELPLGLRVTAQMTSATMTLPQSSRGVSENLLHVPAPAPKPIPSSAFAGPPKFAGLVLQVGAMMHRENADALVATLRKQSFPAFVLERDGDSFYRVDVGPYPDGSNARIAKTELESGGFGTAIERRLPVSAR